MTTESKTQDHDPIGAFFDALSGIETSEAAPIEETPDGPGDGDVDGEGAGSDPAAEEGDETPDGEEAGEATTETFPEAEELIEALGGSAETKTHVTEFVTKLRDKLALAVNAVRDETYKLAYEAGMEVAEFYHANPALVGHEGAVQKAAEEVIKSHGAKPRATQLKLVAEKATARLNIVQKATAKPPATGVSPTAAPSKPTSAEGQRAAGALELFEDLKNRM